MVSLLNVTPLPDGRSLKIQLLGPVFFRPETHVEELRNYHAVVSFPEALFIEMSCRDIIHSRVCTAEGRSLVAATIDFTVPAD